MIALIIVVNNTRPSFYGNQFASVLRNKFSLRQNAILGADSPLQLVTEEGMMWVYIRDYFVPNIVEDKYTSGDAKASANEAGTILMNLRRIGAIRIRQLRARAGTCHLRHKFTASVDYCVAPFTKTDQSKAAFGPGDRFQYSPPAGEQSFFIQQRFYPGGGFIQLLNTTNREGAIAHINSLMADQFVDAQTRLIDIRFSFINPYVDNVAVGTIAFEFLAGGGVRPHSNFHLVSLSGFPAGRDYQVKIFFEALLYSFVVYMAIVQIVLLFRQRMEYFSHGWNWLDLTLITLFILLFAFRMQSVKVLEDFEFEVSDDKYVDFSKVEFIRVSERRTLAFAIFLSFFKVFEFLQSNPKLSQLVSTLEEAAPQMSTFLVVILIVLFAFAFSAQLLFGEMIAEFSNFSQTLAKLVRMALGDTDYNELIYVDYAVGSLFFFVLVFFLVLFLLQMFLAIIMGANERVLDEVGEKQWAGADPGALTMAWILAKNFVRKIFGYQPIRIMTEAEKEALVKSADRNRDGFIDAAELERFVQQSPSKTPDLLGVEQVEDLYKRYDLSSPNAFNLAEQRTFFSVLDERRQHIVLLSKLLGLKEALGAGAAAPARGNDDDESSNE
eukprot:a676905_368.p1 GENE.a676905_368~~a676905_368.p1  ORF type:complete len:692 (-),score=360.77 a676905_368:16-1845(-)